MLSLAPPVDICNDDSSAVMCFTHSVVSKCLPVFHIFSGISRLCGNNFILLSRLNLLPIH